MSVRRTTGTAPHTPTCGDTSQQVSSAKGWTQAGGSLLNHPVFRDTRLSYEARGLFGELALLDEGQVFSAESLAEGTPDSAATVQAAMDELAAAGYLAEVAR